MDDKYQLPTDVTQLPLADIKELISNPDVLVGLRESLPEAVVEHSQVIEIANSNIKKVERLQQEVEKIHQLEQCVKNLKEKEVSLRSKWTQCESQMHIKSQPYTRSGIEKALQRETAELEATARQLRQQLDSDPINVSKKYVENQKLYHYKKDMLNCL